MKVLVVGCGNIGSVAAEDLAKNMTPAVDVTVADRDEKRAEAVAQKVNTSNIDSVRLDVSDNVRLMKDLGRCDVVMGFLPGTLGYRLMQACIEAQRDMVDVSYMAENPMSLNEKAVEAGITIIPDCGLAPGISNLLVGHTVKELDTIHLVRMMVGGLPEKPVPPLEYVVTWSPESLIDEYTRKARIIIKGKMAEVEALTGTESVDFPNVGKLEAFFTDGLRTLMYTVEADEMWEKTLRYPGHADKIRLLQALGFFDEKKIDIDGLTLSPRRLAAKLLGKTLSKPEIRDFVALKVVVSGVKDGLKKRQEYLMLDRYDKERHVTAMARTTAYPASIAAQLLLKGEVSEEGVIPPEKLGMDDRIFKMFLGELKNRRIEITKQSSTL